MQANRRFGFFVDEDDEFYYDDPVVGSLFSNVDPPRQPFWRKPKEEPKRPVFGFSRVLED